MNSSDKRWLGKTLCDQCWPKAHKYINRFKPKKPRSKPSAQRKEAKAAQHREGLQTKPEWLPAVAFPKPDGGADRELKRTKHAVSTDEIHAAVFRRAGGVCECCKLAFTDIFPGQLDHWLSGNGRRRPKQSVKTCWALCGTTTTGCHGARTLNRPSAAYWNEMFRRHCETHGYPFQPHIEHQPVPRKSA